MTVSDLIHALQAMQPHAPVLLRVPDEVGGGTTWYSLDFVQSGALGPPLGNVVELIAEEY